MKRSDFLIIAAIILGFVVIDKWQQPPDTEKMQREYTAYRHCMQVAGKLQCHMTPQDFVRYYELKYKLEE